jgi:predicted dehydrogenase
MKLALLGVWHVHAVHHLEDSIKNPVSEIVVVWDSDPEAGQAFADRHDLPFVDRLDLALSWPDVSAVVVDTATSEHPDVIHQAIAAGKHVFVEKVLAIDSENAVSLIEAARDAGLILRVSLPRLLEAPFVTAQRLISEGAIGTVTGSRIRFAHDGALREWLPRHFLDANQAGGGALIDLGAHPIYLGLGFHGAVPQTVTTRIRFGQGGAVEDNAAMLLEYEGGAIGIVETSFVASFFSYSVQVDGHNGTLITKSGDTAVSIRRHGQHEWVDVAFDPPLPKPFDVFISEVLEGHQDPTHHQTALLVTQIVEAGYRSASQNASVAFEAALLKSSEKERVL